jgi:hypothetical protein
MAGRIEFHQYLASRFLGRGDVPRVDTMFAKRIDGSPPQLVRSDGTDHEHVEIPANQLRDAAGEICRRAAKPRSVWKNVPQNFAESDDTALSRVR